MAAPVSYRRRTGQDSERNEMMKKLLLTFAVFSLFATVALAGAFENYTITGSFTRPDADAYDVLNDGRIIALDGANVYTETAIGSHSFTQVATLTGMDCGGYYGSSFLRVSPDGTKFAVGNNGGATWSNFEVGVFNVAGLSGNVSGAVYSGINHYDAEWADNTNLLITTGSIGSNSGVTALDTTSSTSTPVNPTVINNIVGASGGVTVDSAGRLYTGNAYDNAPGGSDTGWIKAFDNTSWRDAITNSTPIDFEASGTQVVDLLSCASLGFDNDGNFFVGGGDAFSGSGDHNYAALVNADALADVLAGTGPIIDPTSPEADLRKFDPEPLVSNYSWYWNYNSTSEELYLTKFDCDTVWVAEVPEPMTISVLALGGGLVLLRRRRTKV